MDDDVTGMQHHRNNNTSLASRLLQHALTYAAEALVLTYLYASTTEVWIRLGQGSRGLAQKIAAFTAYQMLLLQALIYRGSAAHVTPLRLQIPA